MSDKGKRGDGPGGAGHRGEGRGEGHRVEELRARVEYLDEALAVLGVAEADVEAELIEEERWVEELTEEFASGAERKAGWGPFRLLWAFLGWLSGGGWVAVAVGLALLLLVVGVFAEREPAGPSPDGLVGVGSVMQASAGSAPIGAPCAVEVGPAVRGRCPFAIECGDWRYEEAQPCWQGNFERDTGEGGTTTDYYLIARSSDEAGWKFGFDEHEMMIAFSGAPGDVLILLHTIEGRGTIK